MKKTLLLLILCLQGLFSTAQQTTLTVFNEILFYDGYAGVVSFPVPEGVIRHRNDLYAKKLTDAQLAAFGTTLTADVTIKAACDNYDRIGNVNLAFVPKGATTYVPSEVPRIELGRFITPFMNKNIAPTQVPYTFNVDNIAKIVKDPAILAAYDIWAELEVFGVPYAAQTQVSGCSGRNDVFYGTLKLVSNSETQSVVPSFLLPLNFKKDLNNYAAGASDAVGQTVRTITFTLSEQVLNAKMYLITSNHGANSGGEEYNRRQHNIFVDDVLKLQYTPGGLSCEPFRIFNTQGNGIYGPVPRTLATWASFSNWCPGDVIPIRTIALGDLAPGVHTFKITVPTAVFANQEGYIPVSVYLQGVKYSLGTEEFNTTTFSLYPNPTNGQVTIQSEEAVKSAVVYNMLGQQVWKGSTKQIDLSGSQPGVYTVQIEFANEHKATQKIVRK